MKERILILDFDGVILDGIEEYWFSCCRVYDSLENLPANTTYKKFKEIPQKFIDLRPLVKKAWEMVILAHEIIFFDNVWSDELLLNFKNNFHSTCKLFLIKRNWKEDSLQNLLDKIREKIIEENFKQWISMHKLFDGVESFLNKLKEENINFIILSSKNSKFIKHISHNLKINPLNIYGYDHGTKLSILKKLNMQYRIIGFVEDRKEALEEVLNDDEISTIPCFFAEWGYNLDIEKFSLNEKITIVTLGSLSKILEREF